jgi:hypothetical protein
MGLKINHKKCGNRITIGFVTAGRDIIFVALK